MGRRKHTVVCYISLYDHENWKAICATGAVGCADRYFIYGCYYDAYEMLVRSVYTDVVDFNLLIHHFVLRL